MLIRNICTILPVLCTLSNQASGDTTGSILSIHEARLRTADSRLNTVEGNVTALKKNLAEKLDVGTVNATRVNIANRWSLRFTGGSNPDDDWLRLFSSTSDAYFGGFAATRLWGDEIYAGGGWILRNGGGLLQLVDFNRSLSNMEANSFQANSMFANEYSFRNGLKIKGRSERVTAGIFTYHVEFLDASNAYAGVKASSFTQTSDARLKQDIKPLEGSLARLMELKPVQYSWKKDGPQPKEIGFLAQDIQKQFPEVVTEDADGSLGVKYSNLTAPLVQAIQEQQTLIHELRAEVEALKNKSKP